MKPNIVVKSVAITDVNDIEILSVELDSCVIVSAYKPPMTDFNFIPPSNFDNNKNKIVMGDFNCHSTAWGHKDTNEDGANLERWAELNDRPASDLESHVWAKYLTLSNILKMVLRRER
jgi:hypothetical protein